MVRDCPHTRKSNGVVSITPEIIAALAGAVYDKDEWAVILTGSCSEDGYEVNVTGWRVPEQTRDREFVGTDTDLLRDGDQAVVHSHHNMGARFSQKDKAELNPRYPASIVIAQSKTAVLGFDYEAVGKVVLPCGSKGEIEFKIQPTGMPMLAAVRRVVHKRDDLGDCLRFEHLVTDAYKQRRKSACGLEERTAHAVFNAFGSNDMILKEVEKLPRTTGIQQQYWLGGGGYSNYNSSNGNTQPRVDGYICGHKHCKGDLYWSALYPTKGKCEKCRTFWTIPKEEKETKKRDDSYGIDPDDMKDCLDCGNYVFVGDYYNCPVCHSDYCAVCDKCHNGRCPNITGEKQNACSPDKLNDWGVAF
jgi:hypothetical protein